MARVDGAIRCAICMHSFVVTQEVARRVAAFRKKHSPYVCMRCEAVQAYETSKGMRSKGGF